MTPIVEDDGRGVNVPPSKASNVSTKESTEKTMDAADATETSNKTKLNEDATKIVRAIKKLHVPAKSNSSLDGCELEKKKGIQLKNGVQLSYNVDVLKKNVNLSDNYKSSEMCQISTEKNGLKSEKENTLKCADENLSTRKSVRIEGKIVVEKNRSTKEDQDFSENVQVKHEDDVIHDFDHEEWEIVDEVHTDTSTCSESCVNEKIKRKSPIQSPDPFLTPTTPLSSSVKEVTALTARLCNAAAGNSSYFQKKATSTLETTENSAEKNENSEEDNTSEEGMQMDVTKVVEQIINRLPDNENGDVVEKLNVSSELSTSSDDVKSNSPTMMSEFSLAASLKRRCKDDNGEKSPLVCTVKKVRLEADPKQECSSSALKTMLKILPKEKVKKLRRKELEELISKEISKYLTSSNYSEIARLQQKVAQLEKSVGYWRKQVGHLQKQHIEDDIAIQRKAQNLRRLGTGPVVKVVTRSVGIQVQTQIPSVLRFNRMVPSELVLGETSRSGVRNCTSTPPVSMMKLKSSSVVPVTAKPVISGAGLAKVSTAGYQSQVSKMSPTSGNEGGKETKGKKMEDIKKLISAKTFTNRAPIWLQFKSFCVSNNYELRRATPNLRIASILKDWAMHLRNCDQYRGSNVKQLWNISVKLLQMKYFNKYKRTLDPIIDSAFKPSGTARDSNDGKEQLKSVKKRSGLRSNEEFDENCPDGLQRKVCHVLTNILAWKINDVASASVYHFREEVDKNGQATNRIEYNPSFRSGSWKGKKKTRSKWLCESSNSDLCPVRLYRKLLSKRPPRIRIDSVFLCPHPNWENENSTGWYKNMPVGKCQILKWRGIETKGGKIVNFVDESTEKMETIDNVVVDDDDEDDVQQCFNSKIDKNNKIVDSMFGNDIQRTTPLILSLPRTYAKTSTISNVNVTVQNRQMITTNAVTTRPVTSIANKLPASVSVSILQPKSTNLTSVSTSAPSNLVVNPVTVPTTIVPKVASVVAPSSTVRTMLDSQRRVPMDGDGKKRSTPTNVDRVMRSSTRRVDGKSESQPNAHTLNLTRAALRIFRRFMTSVGEKREIVELTPFELSQCLTNFFASAKKKDGSEYGAHTLTCIFDSIDRHLRSCNYSASVKKDEMFYRAREQMRLKRRQLQKKKSCVNVKEKSMVDIGLLKTEEEIAQDVGLFTDWMQNPPINDQRPFFHLSTSTLDTYLAQFFTMVEVDRSNVLISDTRLKRIYDNIDVYLSNRNYPMSIKRESHFRHSIECFSFREKLLQGVSLDKVESENEYLRLERERKNYFDTEECDGRKISRGWSTKESCEAESEKKELSTSLFEPDISLVEDDNEIEVETNLCDEKTTNRVKSDLEILKNFLSAKWVNENRNIENIPLTELDRLLAQFFLLWRKPDGSEHDASDLVRMHDSIHCYLKDRYYSISIKSDAQFSYSRLCMASKCYTLSQLHQMPHDIFVRQVQCLHQKGVIGNSDPVALICCLWCYFGRGFHLSTNTEHANLRWGDVELKNENGVEYLEYTGGVSNILEGKLSGTPTYKLSTVDAGEGICPVEAFKVYTKNRPVSATKLHDRFYLHVASSNAKLWFTDKALTERNVEQIQSYVRAALDKVKIGSVDIELSELKASLLNKLLQIDEAPREERRHVIPVPTVPPKETGSAKKMSDQKVKEVFVAGGHAPNTIIKTMHDVNVFRQWLSTVEKTRDFSSFPPVKLNRLLLGFFSTLKKRDGSDYEPNSLYSIYFSIDRYLRVLKYPANIKSDVSFLQCRTFFQDRRKEFDAEREAVPQHVIQRRQVDISFSDQDIECLRRRGYLGTHNPDAMLLALWYMNTVLLGIHSQRAQLHMLWGDFDLKTDVDGRSFVEYHQHASKAKLISCPPNGIATFINKKPSKIYADVKNVENCPVRLFMEFRDRRPPFTLKSDSRFYLCPGADEPNSRIWFRSVPIGRNKLGAIPSTIWNLIRKARDGDSGAVSPSVSPKPCPKQTLPTTSNDKLCISLIPFFPSTSVSSEKDNSSKLPQVIQASAISAPNVVLFPVVSTPTVGVNCSSSTTGVQIIPIV